MFSFCIDIRINQVELQKEKIKLQKSLRKIICITYDNSLWQQNILIEMFEATVTLEEKMY